MFTVPRRLSCLLEIYAVELSLGDAEACSFTGLLISSTSPLLAGRTVFLDSNLEPSAFLFSRGSSAFIVKFTAHESGLNLFVVMAIIPLHSTDLSLLLSSSVKCHRIGSYAYDPHSGAYVLLLDIFTGISRLEEP